MFIWKFCPHGVVCPCPVAKHEKLCIKSDFKDIFLKLATNGQGDKAFLLSSWFCPQRVVCPCHGAIYMWKNIKMCIKSEFKEICLKQITNGRSDNGFLLTSKVCPQWGFGPCPGAIYIYKIIKNVNKSRFQRDHFETYNIWAKRKGHSVVIKMLFPMDCLSLPGLYIHMVKMYIKSDFKAICFKPEQMGKVIRVFCWHQKFVPRGLSALAPGLYTYIKSFKVCIKSDFFF